MIAVLDDVGADRVVVVASSVSGQNAIMFAAERPNRVESLILVNTHAHYLRDDDCTFGIPAEKLEVWLERAELTWGTDANLALLAPSQARDERFCEWWSRCSRLGLTPRQLTDMTRACFPRDERPRLASVTVPTLVLHRQGDRYTHADAGRYLAEHIPNATFILLPGDDHLMFAGDVDGLMDEIEQFITGHHQAPEGDVVLAAILFTDIVGSTEQSARLGPRRWRQLLDQHDAVVRSALRRHRGREIKTLGDGFMATFDSGTRAVRCATDIARETQVLELPVRTGVHAGDVEILDADVAGLAVTVAKRICDLAGPGQVLVSETIRELLVGSRIELTATGAHTLKGLPSDWTIWSASPPTSQ